MRMVFRRPYTGLLGKTASTGEIIHTYQYVFIRQHITIPLRTYYRFRSIYMYAMFFHVSLVHVANVDTFFFQLPATNPKDAVFVLLLHRLIRRIGCEYLHTLAPLVRKHSRANKHRPL